MPSDVTCPIKDPSKYESLIYGFKIGTSLEVKFGKFNTLITAPEIK